MLYQWPLPMFAFLLCITLTLVMFGETVGEVFAKSGLFILLKSSTWLSSLINNWMVTEVVGPGGIWGWVQGVGSDPLGTRSQP